MEREPGFEGGEDYDKKMFQNIKLTPEQEKMIESLLAENPSMPRGEAIRIVLGQSEEKNE